MRLDPERALAPATVDAICDLLDFEVVPDVDDSALLALALGVADAQTRLACARAILAYPATRARLMVVRSSVGVSLAASGPDSGEGEELGLLCAFAAPFTARTAGAVFPARFGEPTRLGRLAEGGWLDVADTPWGTLYSIPDRLRTATPSLDKDTRARFVAHFADLARWIDRTLAEGQGIDAIETLRRTLPDLRSAWRYADAAGDAEAVATFVSTLATELMESAEWSALADLASVGYRAADALDRVTIRSRLLSYEGVSAARRGEDDRAVELWTERVELNRRVGNAVAEADALIDLASEASVKGDVAAYRTWITQAEDAVERAGRADLKAGFWSTRAHAELRRDDLTAAAVSAQRGLDVYSGSMGMENGFSIWISAARVFSRCGQTDRALALVSDALAHALEAHRPLQASAALETIAGVVEADGRPGLAERSLLVAAKIHREAGARRLERVEREIARLRLSHPDVTRTDFGGPWELGASAILAEVRDLRPEFAVV